MRRIAPVPRQGIDAGPTFRAEADRVAPRPLIHSDGARAFCRSRQEVLDGVARLALLVEHEVAGTLEDLDIGLGNEAPPSLRLLRRDELVLLAPDQQRRHGEAVE